LRPNALHALRVSSCKQDYPDSYEGENCRPDAYKEKNKSVGKANIKPSEKSTKKQFQAGIAFLIFD
jgi:hypothetical protein